MRMKYEKKFSFFTMYPLFTITKGKEQICACVSHDNQSAWTAS